MPQIRSLQCARYKFTYYYASLPGKPTCNMQNICLTRQHERNSYSSSQQKQISELNASCRDKRYEQLPLSDTVYGIGLVEW